MAIRALALFAAATTGCFVTPAAPPCSAGGWGTPSRLAELDTTDDEDGPWMSADRTHVVFSSKHGETYSVLEASRAEASAPFGAAVAIPEVVVAGNGGPIDDRPEPVMSEDLRHIWLGRHIDYADRDLTTAMRAGPGMPFGLPSPTSFDVSCMPDGCGVNSSNDEVDPGFSPDLMTVYFASDRAVGHYRLFVAQGTAPGLNWGPATLISAIAGNSIDRAPAITPGGTTLLFESDRTGGRAIFASAHTGPGLADFAAPIPFAPLADGFASGAPYMLPDASAIIYSSDHGDGNGRDLYVIEHCD